MDSADAIKLRILWQEVILDYPGEPSVITRSLYEGGLRIRDIEGDVTKYVKARVRERVEDATQLALKVEERLQKQRNGFQMLEKVGKWNFRQEPTEVSQPWWHLNFYPVKTISYI